MVAEDLNNITANMDNSAWLLKYAYFLIYGDECIADKNLAGNNIFPQIIVAISVSNCI